MSIRSLKLKLFKEKVLHSQIKCGTITEVGKVLTA